MKLNLKSWFLLKKKKPKENEKFSRHFPVCIFLIVWMEISAHACPTWKYISVKLWSNWFIILIFITKTKTKTNCRFKSSGHFGVPPPPPRNTCYSVQMYIRGKKILINKLKVSRMLFIRFSYDTMRSLHGTVRFSHDRYASDTIRKSHASLTLFSCSIAFQGLLINIAYTDRTAQSNVKL